MKGVENLFTTATVLRLVQVFDFCIIILQGVVSGINQNLSSTHPLYHYNPHLFYNIGTSKHILYLELFKPRNSSVKKQNMFLDRQRQIEWASKTSLGI